MGQSNSSYTLHPRTAVSVIRYTLIVGGTGLLFYSLPRIYHLVSMTFLALLITYLLNPTVDFLERYRLSRGIATALVYISLGVVMGIGLFRLSPFLWEQFLELRSFLNTHDPTKLMEDYLLRVETTLGFVPEGWLVGQVDAAYAWILAQLSGILQNLYVALQYFILVPFIAFFLTRDRRKIRRFIVQSAPNQFFEVVFNIYYKIDQQLGNYIRGIVIESIIVAILSIIGLWIVNVRYLFVIGIFAGIANIIPYFGPVAGAIPAITVKFFGVSDPVYVLPVVLVFAIIQLIDNIILKPVVVAKTMSLHPLLVLIVVVGGGQIYGILGMIFSIPIAAMFIVIVGEINWAVQNYSFRK